MRVSTFIQRVIGVLGVLFTVLLIASSESNGWFWEVTINSIKLLIVGGLFTGSLVLAITPALFIGQNTYRGFEASIGLIISLVLAFFIGGLLTPAIVTGAGSLFQIPMPALTGWLMAIIAAILALLAFNLDSL